MRHQANILLASIALCFATTIPVAAQSNGSNSSYSRFGLGTMPDQSQGFNRSMGGVAQGVRNGKIVNMLNPASYSAIDSLSFIFDVGMSLQYGHLKSGGTSVNARNTSLSYVNAGFHVAKGLGMSFGFVPYSTIGYNFSTSGKVGTDYTTAQKITTETTYYGNGGIHQMYIGAGWNPFSKLSIGANVSFLWGDYNHSMAQVFYQGGSSSSAYSSMNAEYSGDIKTYKIDLGIQYPVRLSPRDWLTIGATVGLGHNTKNDASMTRYTSTKDTLTVTAKDAFDLPYTYSAGLSWQHAGCLIVAVDYTREQWSKCKVPVAESTEDAITLRSVTGQYLDRNKIAFGVEYTPDPEGLKTRKYMRRVQYKIGAKYSTPYVKVNGCDGPKEYGITAGLSLPISRSYLNVGAEWLRRKPSTSTLITENYFMLNLGITFNEKWFMKWKID